MKSDTALRERSEHDLQAALSVWREQALCDPVHGEVLTRTGRLLNYHGRVVSRSLDEVWKRLSGMGTLFDDIWPMSWVRRKNQGPLAVGMRSGHGTIRCEVVGIAERESIEWRFTMELLQGRDAYRIRAVDHGTYVETLIDGLLVGELLEIWPTGPGPMHDWVMERMLDGLDKPPAPWFDLDLLVKIR